MGTNGPYTWGNGPKPRRGKPKPMGGDHAGKKGCCFAGQAVKAVWAGKFRLARRFARLDLKVRTGRLEWSA